MTISTTQQFVDALPAAFGGQGDVLHAGRNTVKAFVIGGRCIVVKRYKRPSLVQRIVYTFFRKSKAERAYLFAGELQRRGFRTPSAIAYRNLSHCGLLSDSYFIADNCPHPSVRTLHDTGQFSPTDTAALGRFLANLHKQGVLHGDLNISNILCERDNDNTPLFWLIDTNRTVFKQPTASNQSTASECSNSIAFKQPTARDCADNLKRLTHDRSFLSAIISCYAQAQALDPATLTAQVFRRLDRFEARKSVMKKLKTLLRHAPKNNPKTLI